MFGFLKRKPAPARFAVEPKPGHSGPDGAANRNADEAIAALSDALGLDLDFGPGLIFAPSLWNIPDVGDMLRRNGLEANMVGNRIALLKSPATVAALAQMPKDHSMRKILYESRFGAVLFNPDAENGYSDELVGMQRGQLTEWARREDLTEEGRHYAVMDLHRFSFELMAGRVSL
jgi:hypothetical protein